MRIAVVFGAIVFLGLQACGNGTGKKTARLDANVAVNEAGIGEIDGSVPPTSFGDAAAIPESVPEVALTGFPDGSSDRLGVADACSAAAVDAPVGKLSVKEVLEGVDPLMCAPITVVGHVFEDVREKPGDWPAPAQSPFILQDGGDQPGYENGGSSISYIQLYSVADLGPLLRKHVVVTAYLRVVAIIEGNGPPCPFPYLDVITITSSEEVAQDAGSGPEVSGMSDARDCRPLAYSGGASSFSGSRTCPVDPRLPECKSEDQGAVVYRDEACALATIRAHPDCEAWQRDLASEYVILTDPFNGCEWPLSVDSVFDCGDYVSVAYSVIQPCTTCDAVYPRSIAIVIPNDPKPVRATASLQRPVSCP